MSIDSVLTKLDGLKRTGQDRWIARCPAHEDKTASLSVRHLDDGRTLIHCFAGCDNHSILQAINLDFDDLFPDGGKGQHFKPERRPFSAADVLRCIAFEALVVVCAESALLTGEPLSQIDRERLSLASARIRQAVEGTGYGE